MTNLERYLNQATRGIWGRRKLEIREELESDILERTKKFELMRLSRETATARAIQELGDARVVNRGMTGVYMMPTFFKSAIVAAMISVVLVLSVQPSIAQVANSTRFPIAQCQDANAKSFMDLIENKNVAIPCDSGENWISISSLKQTLQPLGVKVAEYPDVAYRTIGLTFPEHYTATLNLDSVQHKFGDTKIIMNQDFFNATILMHALMDTPLHLRMTGWKNPRISVGKTTFYLGKDNSLVNTSHLYVSGLYSEIDSLFPYKLAMEDIVFGAEQMNQHFADAGIIRDEYIHKIRYNAEPNTIVVFLSREKFDFDGSKQLKEWRRAFIAPVSTDGTFVFSSRSKTLRFGTKIDKLPTSVTEGLSDVVAYRFNGDLSINGKHKLTVIKPAALVLESSKKR